MSGEARLVIFPLLEVERVVVDLRLGRGRLLRVDGLGRDSRLFQAHRDQRRGHCHWQIQLPTVINSTDIADATLSKVIASAVHFVELFQSSDELRAKK